ncbi:hypothetical protein MnTg04_00055 [bacterium MnTg04]|nr:hypothetical protein MnTg04_00055 [bacterium MnTg04]
MITGSNDSSMPKASSNRDDHLPVRISHSNVREALHGSTAKTSPRLRLNKMKLASGPMARSFSCLADCTSARCSRHQRSLLAP